MLHICPRLPDQSFVEPPFEEEILAFLHFFRHSGAIRKLTDVNINKLHQPWRSFAAIINKCLTKKSSGYDSLRLSQAQILNSYAYQEYYAVATGATPPKPKATKASKAKSLSALSEVAMTEAQQLKLVTKRSLQQTHISQSSGFGADEGTSSIPRVPNVPTDEYEEEITWNSTDEEGDDDEGKDDDDDNDNGDDGEERDGDDDNEDNDGRKGNEDDDDQEDEGDDEEKGGNGEENLGLNVGREEGHEEEEEDELYRDVNINQGREFIRVITIYDKFQPSGGYHAVPPSYTGTFMSPKPDLVFNTAPTAVETDHLAFNPVETSIPAATHKPSSLKSVLTQSKPVSITAVRLVSAVVPKIKVTRTRLTHLIVIRSKSPIRRHIARSPSPKTSNSTPRVTAIQAPVVSAAQGNNSYLSDFEELNGGCVAFGGNPKGGKISGKGKIKTGKLHMDLFGPTFVKSLNKKSYCLVGTDDYSRVLVTKPHHKTSYELLHGRTPSIGFMRPFGYLVTILNTLDPLGKFEGKVDEGFLVGYSRNVAGSGPTWLFDIDSLTRTINSQPVIAENQTNPSAGFQDKFDTEKAGEEVDQQYVLFPVWSYGFKNPHNNDGDAAFDVKEHDFDAKKPESEVNVSLSSSAQSRKQDDKTKKEAKGKSHVESFTGYRDLSAEFEDCLDNSSNEVNAAGSIVPIVGQNSPNSTNTFSAAGPSNAAASPTYGKSSFIDASQLSDDPDMPELEDITYSYDENNVGVESDFNNLETSITKVWVLVGLPHEKRAIGTKWVYRNKKDERGIVIRNKARLVAQGHIQEEGIDYEEVFALVTRIKAIRLFLAYASFIGFMVYQMDVKSAFLYGTIEEEVYVCQTLGFEDPDHPDKVYKEVNALYGLHQAPRAWQKEDILLVQICVDDIIFGATNKDLCKSFEKLMKDKFQMSSIRELAFFLGLQVKQKKDGIFISQDKYVAEILRKFGLTKEKSAKKPLLKDPDGEDVDVHTYRSMIGSLMYLTSSRPDIMFAVILSRMESLKRMSHVSYILSAGYLTTQQMVINSLFDKKKVVVREAAIIEVLRLDDVEGVDCLPNEKIFTELARMGYEKPSTKLTFYKAFFSSQWKFLIYNILQCMSAKRTLWNEFSSSMASAVICLSIGKGFSEVETPLFEGMLVEQEIEEEGDADEHVEEVTASDDAHGEDSAVHGEVPTVTQEPSIPSPTLPTPPPQPPQDVLSTSQRVDTSDDTVIDDESNQGRMIAKMDKDDVVVLMDDKDEDKKVEEAKEDETESAEVQEVVDVVTTAKLITKVVTAASETVTAASVIIPTVGPQVLVATLTATPARVTAALSRRRKGVDEQYARELHAELNKDIDSDKSFDHVKRKAKEDPAVKRYQVLKRKPQTEAQARKNMIMYLKNVAGFKMDYFNGMSYDDIRLIFEAKFNSNVAFLLKTKEQIEEENRAL
nr:putative ribonuclease H-like domain-containing protein [Tanacetum cinerariifolium]GEW34261.1 putative ribonuclease H-like domain-containing protein [Tanacetum cinerariifolium]